MDSTTERLILDQLKDLNTKVDGLIVDVTTLKANKSDFLWFNSQVLPSVFTTIITLVLLGGVAYAMGLRP